MLRNNPMLLTNALMEEVAPVSSATLAVAMSALAMSLHCLGWFLCRLGIGDRYAH